MSKGGSQTTHYNNTTKTDMNAYEKAHQENFTSPEMKSAYGRLKNNAFNNYDTAANFTRNAINNYNAGKSLGDDSYFKQGWNDWNGGFDLNQLKKMGSADPDPYNDANYMKAINDIFANKKYEMGNTINQIYQNGIGTGMGGSTGHQSALYNAAQRFANQQAADMGSMYLQQRQNNANNMIQANNLLNGIYQGRTNAGLGAWETSQQGYDRIMNGLNAQNTALGTLGKAIELGSDPTMTSEGRQWGTSNSQGEQTTEKDSGWGSPLGMALGMVSRMPIF